MSEPPDVSVIVPVFAGERYLTEALGTIAAQTHGALEAIVVIDGSTDACAEIATAAGARVLVQDRAGVASARNAGIAVARGELLAFLDQDDLWHPDKLARQIGRISALPRVDIVLCRLVAELIRDTPRPTWLPAGWELTPQPGYLPSSWLVRATAFDNVGGFDDELRIACDADWLARAKDLGHATAMLPEALLRWRIHDANASYDQETMDRERLVVLRRTAARQLKADEDA